MIKMTLVETETEGCTESIAVIHGYVRGVKL